MQLQTGFYFAKACMSSSIKGSAEKQNQREEAAAGDELFDNICVVRCMWRGLTVSLRLLPLHLCCVYCTLIEFCSEILQKRAEQEGFNPQRMLKGCQRTLFSVKMYLISTH